MPLRAVDFESTASAISPPWQVDAGWNVTCTHHPRQYQENIRVTIFKTDIVDTTGSVGYSFAHFSSSRRPLRLSVRTLGSQPGKRGSIPLGGAISIKTQHLLGFLLFYRQQSKRVITALMDDILSRSSFHEPCIRQRFI